MKNQMTLFVMFALNYPPRFVEQAFPNNTHVWGKWEEALSVSGSGYGSMVKFWTLLSQDNQDTLTDWITKNYKG